MLSVRSGAWSPRLFEPVAAELVSELLERRPDLAGYPETVVSLARSEARAVLLDEYLSRVGMFDPKGKLREGPLRFVRQFAADADRLRAELGLTPRSEAVVQRDRAQAAATVVDLHAVRAAGSVHASAYLADRDREALEAPGDGRSE